MPQVSRFDRMVLLGVFGAGVFLAGLELMVTAVALPAIVTDLADWTHLREASWIVNGYLLASIVTMPSGRAARRCLGRATRCSSARWCVFIAGSMLAGRAQSLEELVAGRIVQAIGGGALDPGGHRGRLRTCSRAPPGRGRWASSAR